jgi:hypothetical protein
MPFLELLSLVMAASAWGPLWRQRKITFRCDCAPIVDAVERGESPEPQIMHLLRQLMQLAMLHGFDFRCVHIPGVQNVGADILSRSGDCLQFRAACPGMEEAPTVVPEVSILPPTAC